MYIQINISSSKPISLEKREDEAYVVFAENILFVSIIFKSLISRVMRAFCATYYATVNIPIQSAIQAQDLLAIEFSVHKNTKKIVFFFIHIIV